MGLSMPVGAHVTTPCALDAGRGTTGFCACPVEFWFYFDTILPCYSPIPPFENGNVSSVALYLGSMQLSF
jgi:hypothetical protein